MSEPAEPINFALTSIVVDELAKQSQAYKAQELLIPFANAITSKFRIFAYRPDPDDGIGTHRYHVIGVPPDGKLPFKQEIVFHKGPLIPPAAHNGILTPVLMAILVDHLQSFQNGQFPSEETEQAIRCIKEAEMWIARRADRRAAEGVLGKHQK